MKREIFYDPEVFKHFSDFKVHIIDIEQYPEYTRQRWITAVPGYIRLNAQLEENKRGHGYKTPREFWDWANDRD